MTRSTARLTTAAALLVVPLLAVLPPPASGSAEPGNRALPGFADTVVVPGLTEPTGIAWTPDGRILVAEDPGRIRVVADGVLLPTPALDLGGQICPQGERGLMSVAVDPRFRSNHFIYYFWTHDAHDYCGQNGPNAPENRVTRAVLGADDLVVPGSQQTIVDHMLAQRWNHNGGDVHFGADGLLYVSVGDGGCVIDDPTRCGELNTNSRRLDIAQGKILRVTRTGAVPAGNPYVGAPGARRCMAPAGPQPGTGPCTETFASGFRNPFRFVLKPGTNTFYVNDVGQSTWEEIDRLRGGADYGWNVREGHCALGSTTDCGPTRFQDPLHDYSHAATGCGSITGGAFVPPGLWSPRYDGAYLFSDYVCGTIFRLVPLPGGGFSQDVLLANAQIPVDLAFGPDGAGSQALFYLDYGNGAVHEVTPAVGNTPPTADFFQRPDGLTVTLDGSASSDPDPGDAVSEWDWDFGDGSTATTTGPRVIHTYATAQDYTATLVVHDGAGAASAPFSKTVLAGEHPPSVQITAPPPTARYVVGQQVTLTATASDAEDGTLPPDAITWTVLLHHGTHTHPYAGPVTGSSLTLSFPAPEDLAAAETSYLSATAVAADSRGLTSRDDRRLLPKKVTLSFATRPTGGQVQLNGVPSPTPTDVVSWPGYSFRVSAPDQTISGTPYVFGSWSDGGARTHALITPGTGTALIARFRAG